MTTLRHSNTLRPRPGCALAALALACCTATAAHAQTSRTDDREREQWYDPSDWFDDDSRYNDDYDHDDYDYNSYDYEDDYRYNQRFENRPYDTDRTGRRGDRYTRDRSNTALNDRYRHYDNYYNSYYDGYHDGYNDDQFGYDEGIDWSTSRDRHGYGTGYYDGYYDKNSKYDYDPNYYVHPRAQSDRDRMSDRQRASDRNRARGDRYKQLTSMDRMGQSALRRAASENRNMVKIRGTVDRVEYLEGAQANDGRDMLARVHMDDGRSAIVNLGPNMTKSRLTFESGDRVTFCGTPKQDDGRAVLDVHSITANGDTARLAARTSRFDEAYERDGYRYGDSPRNAWYDEDRRYEDNDTYNRDDSARYTDNRRPMRQDQRRYTDESNDRYPDTRNAVTHNQQIQGTVEKLDVETIDSDLYTVMRVSLDSGRTRLVAVDADRFEDALKEHIESGDRVRIEGHESMYRGRPMVFAERVSINGETVSVSSRGQERDGSRNAWSDDDRRYDDNYRYDRGDSARYTDNRRTPGQNQRYTDDGYNRYPDTRSSVTHSQQIEGTVEKLEVDDIDSHFYKVMRVSLDNGRTQLVAVDADRFKDALKERIESGDRVRIEGRKSMLHDHPVVFAERISINGETVSVSSR